MIMSIDTDVNRLNSIKDVWDTYSNYLLFLEFYHQLSGIRIVLGVEAIKSALVHTLNQWQRSL